MQDVLRTWYGYGWWHTWDRRLFSHRIGSTLLLLCEQTADGDLDAFLLGALVERVLTAVAAAGITARSVLQPGAEHTHIQVTHTYTHTHTSHLWPCINTDCNDDERVSVTDPRTSLMSSWLAVCSAPLWSLMEDGVDGGDVSHLIVALSSWAHWTHTQTSVKHANLKHSNLGCLNYHCS